MENSFYKEYAFVIYVGVHVIAIYAFLAWVFWQEHLESVARKKKKKR